MKDKGNNSQEDFRQQFYARRHDIGSPEEGARHTFELDGNYKGIEQ